MQITNKKTFGLPIEPKFRYTDVSLYVGLVPRRVPGLEAHPPPILRIESGDMPLWPTFKLLKRNQSKCEYEWSSPLLKLVLVEFVWEGARVVIHRTLDWPRCNPATKIRLASAGASISH